MQTRHLTRHLLDPTAPARAGLDLIEARSPRALLETEAAGGRWQRSVYELFAEMEEKDGHLYSVLQTRLNGLLGLPRCLPGADTETGGIVREALEAFPRFDEFLRALLDGIAKGFSVIELVWSYDKAGRLIVTDWIAHPQEYFLFDGRGRLLLLTPPFSSAVSENGERVSLSTDRTPLPFHRAARPPARKFIAFRFGRDARNPFGRGLCQRAYWYYWFKKNNLKYWAVFNERFGAPTAVASYGPGTPDEDRRRLLEALESLQTDAGVVVPDNVRIDFVEAARAGADGGTYRSLADWCNDEISRIVLGATLTSGEGRRSGSLALGTVHNAVRQDYIEADARLLAEIINTTLIRWIADLNAGVNAPVPAWSIDSTPPADLEQQIRIDRELVRIGVPVPLSHFRERYGRSAPANDEPSITYDDSNLFQYHLRYGVLTVNEVRQRLRLPPVPWGDRPTRAADASNATPSSDGEGEGGPRPGPSREDQLSSATREDPGEAPESEPFEP